VSEEENNVIDIFTKEPVKFPEKVKALTDNNYTNDMFDNCKKGNFTSAIIIAKDQEGMMYIFQTDKDVKETIYQLELAKDMILRN
jgi:hypothetical protein